MTAHLRQRFLACAALMLLLVPATALAADWRVTIGTFRIGLVAPGTSPADPSMVLVRDAWAKALAMPVEIFLAQDYPALVDAQASGRVEYAVHTALSFAVAARLCDCVEPLAAPVGADGALAARSVLILRKARGAGTPPRVAIPAVQLETAGPVIGGLSDSLMPAMERVSAASLEVAEAMLAGGDADGMLGWIPVGAEGDMDAGGTMARLAERGLGTDDLEVSWRGAALPFGPHAIRKTLDPEAKGILRSLTVSMADTMPDVLEAISPLRHKALRPVQAIDYAPASTLLETLAKTE